MFRSEFARFQRVEPPADAISRYAAPLAARQPNFVGYAGDAAATLRECDIAILGTGSVGQRIAKQVARFRPRRIWLADHGVNKAESMLTHDILPEDIGQSKALRTAQLCGQISPQTEVLAVCSRLQHLGFSALADVDLCFLASDNLAAEMDLGQLCAWLGAPLIQGSVHGETLVAQVRVFGNQTAGGPCPACTFSAGEFALLHDEQLFSCNPADGEAGQQTIGQPTMSTSWLCALAADLSVGIGTRLLLGLGRSVADSQSTFCAFTLACSVADLKRKDSCPCDHRPWGRASAPRPVSQCSAGELVACAGFSADRTETTVRVDGYEFIEHAVCCAGEREVRQFVELGRSVPVCCSQCGRPLQPAPFYTHRDVPLVMLPRDVRLEALGVGQSPGALVTRGGHSVLVTEKLDP